MSEACVLGPMALGAQMAYDQVFVGMGGWSYDGGLGLTQPAAGAQRLDEAEAIRLLASISYGRVIFTIKSLPAIRPVNHLVDEGRVIIRTRLTAAISGAVRSSDGVIVAYESDSIDPQTRTGGASSSRATHTPSQIPTRSCATSNCSIRG